jgi:hypothetical protein
VVFVGGIRLTDKEPKALVDAIGVPATLEQMAEECNELAHACLKLARYRRGENLVHGKTYSELVDNLHEEMADVYVTLREIRKIPDLIDNEKIGDTIDYKRKRMAKRLGVKADSFIF